MSKADRILLPHLFVKKGKKRYNLVKLITEDFARFFIIFFIMFQFRFI